jgi:hypothetical protein
MLHQAFADLRGSIPEGYEVLVDPVTHKIERPYFRSKSSSYGKLSYYLFDQFPSGVPSPADLAARSSDVARGVFKVQRDFGVSCFLAPPLYMGPDEFPTGATPTPFSVTKMWADAFLKVAVGRPTALSICAHVECLRTPGGSREIGAFIRDYRPKALYLQLVDFELGQNREVDTAVFSFLEMARNSNVDRIIWGHAPNWIHFLELRGVTDFVSGINLQSSLKLEHLEREKDGHVPQNYYIPGRFCRMSPPQAAEAVAKGIVPRCPCPVCSDGVPQDPNPVREHYLHVRSAECAELRDAADMRGVLRERVAETERFISRAKKEGLKIISEPTPALWRPALAA